MAKKNKVPTSVFISATNGLGNAVDTLNQWDEWGYELIQSFAVVAADEQGKQVQAIWLLGHKRNSSGRC